MDLKRAAAGLAARLRAPWLILFEVAAIAAASTATATLPQQPDAEAVEAWGARWPVLGRITRALGLHEIVTSAWFLALVALAFVTLLLVQRDQWRRVLPRWRQPASPEALARAPYRRALPLARCRPAPATPQVASTGRLVLLGSPVFHLGLLMVLVASLGRLLFASQAVVRAVEGMELGADAAAFAAHRSGLLAAPVALPVPLQVVRVEPATYASGALRQVHLDLAVARAGGAAPAAVEVNAPLSLGGVTVSISSSHGVAVLYRRGGAPGVAYLDGWQEGARGRLDLGGGLEARMRTTATSGPVARVDVRVVDRGALRLAGTLVPGSVLPLAADDALEVLAFPRWVTLRATRDRSEPLFLAGIVTGIAGVALMFLFVRVDSGVWVEGEHLVVALRPHRFAPLYADRFEALCRAWERGEG